MDAQTVLPYVEIGLSVLIIAAVLLQQSGASMGGSLGGDNFSAAFHTRRGAERVLFYATIVLGVLFALTAIAALVLA
jgi:protein translocase SecG subunit